MQLLKISGIELAAVSAYLPRNAINNLEDCKRLYGNEAENIVKSVGIETRRVVDPGTSSLDLCINAAKDILHKFSNIKNEIGAVIAITFTPDRLMPGNATAAQSILGLNNEIMAFDINLACSGFCYGLYVASTLVSALQKPVLLLDGDVQSVFTSGYDKGTLPVMADAGTACLLVPTERTYDWFFTFYTDGTGRDALSIIAGGSKHPTSQADLEYRVFSDGSKRRDVDIKMDGFEIFKFVAQIVSKQLGSFISESNNSADDIDAFIPHQANIFMIKQLSKKLGIPLEKLWVSGDKFGNSASASIPVTLASEYKKHSAGKNSVKMLLSGFGAGLSIASAIITTNGNFYTSVL